MFDPSWLWAVFTIVAAAAQTVRNAAQRELTTRLGTVGATHVRFLFGFPFALMFLAGVMIALGQGLPRPPPAFWPWVVLGALTQVAATALMLAAMNDRSFVVVYAYIKTEPVQAALFGLVFLGDVVTPGMAAAILIATIGRGHHGAQARHLDGCAGDAARAGRGGDVRAIGRRLSWGHPEPRLAELRHGSDLHAGRGPGDAIGAALALSLAAQSRRAGLDHAGLAAVPVRGIHGRGGVQFWFLAFALATAASVRTLALVEVLFAQAISRFAFKQATTPREALGVVLIVVGVLLLLWTG